MNIVLESKSRDLLGPLRLGLIRSDVKVEAGNSQLWEAIEDTIPQLANSLALNNVNKLERIAATRKAYKQCGNDPNRYRPSADSLIRRIIKSQGLYRVNNVVDVLNLISIKTGYSIGGYDYQKIEGPIQLGVGMKDEPYIGIGRGPLNIHNLPVLRDELGAFGTPTSDSERTMILSATNEILMVFYDFDFDEALLPILEESSSLLKRYCSAVNPIVDILKLS